MTYVLFFSEVGEGRHPSVGNKAMNLAELSRKDFRVPPGFIVTTSLFEYIMQKREIRAMLNELQKCPQEEIKERTSRLQKAIISTELSEEIHDEIVEAYLSLSVEHEKSTAALLLETSEVFVAVRTSCLSTLKGHKTILNVRGKDRVIKAILECVAAVFSPEVNSREPVAVIVQRMIESEKSGTAYSLNPETNEDEIIIKACFGLGQGESLFPDIYRVDKRTNAVKEARIADKKYKYARDIETGETVKHDLGEKAGKPVLIDKEITEISTALKRIANYFQKHQEMEWAIKKDILYVLESKEISGEYLAGPPERVEVEVYSNHEEKPEMVDLAEQEDLVMVEAGDSLTEELGTAEEKIPIEEVQISEEPSVTADSPETSEYITNLSEESIFSSFRGLQNEHEKPTENSSENQRANRMLELARLNSGNTIVFCHMVLKEILSEKLKRHVVQIPENFSDIINHLLQFENIENLEDLRSVDRARNDFVKNMRFPEPSEVEAALRMVLLSSNSTGHP